MIHDILSDGPLPSDIWPAGMLRGPARLRDRILEKYNPGNYSQCYKMYDGDWFGFSGDRYITFKWLISFDDRELSWTPN